MKHKKEKPDMKAHNESLKKLIKEGKPPKSGGKVVPGGATVPRK